MKLSAARSIADLVETPSVDRILPDAFDPSVVPAVARAVMQSA